MYDEADDNGSVLQVTYFSKYISNLILVGSVTFIF